MIAIALWQPYATLMAIGAKQYETRHWWTDVRGPVLIYAAKKQSVDQLQLFYAEPFYSHLSKAGYRHWEQLPFGALVSRHDLKDVYQTDTVKRIQEGQGNFDEIAFGDYSPGRFAFHMPLIERFPEPIPFKYPLKRPAKFFEVPEAILRRA
jgi:hypothetical protein